MGSRPARQRRHAPGLAIVGLIALVSCLGASGVCAEEKNLSMGTATVGGLFFNIGGPLVQCVNKAWPQVNITAEVTEGTTENLRLLDQKKIQLAIVTPFLAVYAAKGLKMFKGRKIDSRVVVRLTPNANVWVALAKSKLKTIGDLKGHKVAVGPASGGLGLIAREQLAGNNINFKKDIKPFFMGAGEMAEALKDGAVEAAFLTAELAELVNTTHPIKIIMWDEAVLKKFLADNPNYGQYTYPAGHFKGVTYPVTTVDNGVQLICRRDANEDLIYSLTKTIVENLGCLGQIYAPAKAITPQWASSKLANPFHPGAIKYFKEKGLLKE